MNSHNRTGRSLWTVLIALVALSLFVFSVWTLAIDGSDEGEDEPDLIQIAQATLTAREEVQAVRETATAAVPTPTPTVVPTPTPDLLLAQGIYPVDTFAPEPAAGVPATDPAFTDWYGDEEGGLWLAPVNRAGLLPGGWPERPGYWFAGEPTFTMWYGTSTPLVVTGERLDGAAVIPPVEPGRASGQIQWARITIPEPGCWRIIGQAGEESLVVTVDVLPLDERPDMIFARRYLEARPYDPPASCAVDTWIGPEARGNHYIADYWLDLADLSLNMWGWLVAGREQWFGVNGEDIGVSLDVGARSLDSPGPGSIGGDTLVRNQAVQGASLTFPEPGCWEVELTTPEATVSFVFYVYPEECAPTIENGEVLVSCEPPQS